MREAVRGAAAAAEDFLFRSRSHPRRSRGHPREVGMAALAWWTRVRGAGAGTGPPEESWPQETNWRGRQPGDWPGGA